MNLWTVPTFALCTTARRDPRAGYGGTSRPTQTNFVGGCKPSIKIPRKNALYQIKTKTKHTPYKKESSHPKHVVVAIGKGESSSHTHVLVKAGESTSPRRLREQMEQVIQIWTKTLTNTLGNETLAEAFNKEDKVVAAELVADLLEPLFLESHVKGNQQLGQLMRSK